MKKFKIFLGCLPGNTDQEELLSVFRPYDPIKKIKLKKRSRGACIGHGYILCETKKGYKQILANSSQFVYKGRSIEVMPFLYKKNLKIYQKSFNQKRLLISNIPLKATSNDLMSLFSKLGDVHKAFVIESNLYKNVSSETDTSKKGFVIFEEESASTKALEADFYLYGNCLSLEVFKEKVEHEVQKAKESGGKGSTGSRKDPENTPKEPSLENLGSSDDKSISKRLAPNLDFSKRDLIGLVKKITNPSTMSKIQSRHRQRKNLRLNSQNTCGFSHTVGKLIRRQTKRRF